MTPLRLLILTQYFPPETGAPQARLSEMALLLKEKGVEVEILTAMPNYPAGKIFDSYTRKWFMRDTWRDISVIRSFIYPTKNPKLIPRLLNYFSFVISSLIAGLCMARKADIILVESPPLFLGLTAWILSRVRGMKMIFNVSDLWPETAVALGLYDRTSGFVRMAEKLELFLYTRASACTGQSFGIARGILAKHPAAKVALIPNGADCTVFTPAKDNKKDAIAKWVAPNKTIVGYAGLIGLAQGIQLLIDAAKMLEHDPDILFLIVGDGPEREMLQAKAGKNVIFTGLVQKADMPAIVAAFDMTIIPLKNHIPGALPSKMYEAMAAEIPIILAADGDPKELLQRAEAGILANYDDVASVTNAIIQLKNDAALCRQLGKQGRAYVLQHHQRTGIADKLHAVLLATMTNTDFFANEKNFILGKCDTDGQPQGSLH